VDVESGDLSLGNVVLKEVRLGETPVLDYYELLLDRTWRLDCEYFQMLLHLLLICTLGWLIDDFDLTWK